MTRDRYSYRIGKHRDHCTNENSWKNKLSVSLVNCLSHDFEAHLVTTRRRSSASRVIERSSRRCQAHRIRARNAILGQEPDVGGLLRVEVEQLRVRHSSSSISTSTTREQNRLVTRSPPRVKVQAPVRQAGYDERCAGYVIVHAGSDNVELLVCAAVAGFNLYGDEVLAEVAGGGVDVQAVTGRRLDLGGGECARRGVVARVRFGGCAGVQDGAGAGDSYYGTSRGRSGGRGGGRRGYGEDGGGGCG